MAGGLREAVRLRAEAAAAVAKDQPISLFLFERSPRRHVVRFTDGGWWEQSGGLYGAADRSEPWLRFERFDTRLEREVRRVSATRGLALIR